MEDSGTTTSASTLRTTGDVRHFDARADAAAFANVFSRFQRRVMLPLAILTTAFAVILDPLAALAVYHFGWPTGKGLVSFGGWAAIGGTCSFAAPVCWAAYRSAGRPLPPSY